MATRSAPHIIDASTFAQGMIEGGAQRVSHKTQSIQKVALAGAIRPDEESQGAQGDITRGNALVVPEHNS
jgi:hypothetical protein